MNTQPISAVQDQDLLLSEAAMQRAAQRARQLAVQTQTELVVSEGGVLKKIKPEAPLSALQTHPHQTPQGEPSSPRGGG